MTSQKDTVYTDERLGLEYVVEAINEDSRTSTRGGRAIMAQLQLPADIM